jgi:cytochrome c2
VPYHYWSQAPPFSHRLVARAQFTVPAQQAAKPDPAELFVNQCGTCHSVKPNDTPRQGPNLFGVFGRKARSVPGFTYSPGFARAKFSWDEHEVKNLFVSDGSQFPLIGQSTRSCTLKGMDADSTPRNRGSERCGRSATPSRVGVIRPGFIG